MLFTRRTKGKTIKIKMYIPCEKKEILDAELYPISKALHFVAPEEFVNNMHIIIFFYLHNASREI